MHPIRGARTEKVTTGMALFVGTFENKVDRKGRVSLPADFRSELPEGDDRIVYIYPSPIEGALEACDRAFMRRIAAAIEEQPIYSQAEVTLNNTIIAKARKAQLDETGRLVLPPDHAAHAGITDTAVFVGQSSRFQIWAPDRYRAHSEKASARAKDMTLKVGPAGGGT